MARGLFFRTKLDLLRGGKGSGVAYARVSLFSVLERVFEKIVASIQAPQSFDVFSLQVERWFLFET